MQTKTKKGFTLVEILLVVAAISILAGIVILAINPTKQLGEARDAQRRADVNTILNAVYQYALDNSGTLPASACIDVTAKDICKTGKTCAAACALTDLTNLEKYLVSIPIDPGSTADTVNESGYQILKTANGRVTVSAPDAENGTIAVTR